MSLKCHNGHNRILAGILCSRSNVQLKGKKFFSLQIKNFQVINYKSRSYSNARHTQVWHVRSWCSSDTHISLAFSGICLSCVQLYSTTKMSEEVDMLECMKKAIFLHFLLVARMPCLSFECMLCTIIPLANECEV